MIMKLVCGGGNSKPKPLQVQSVNKVSINEDDSQMQVSKNIIKKIERKTGSIIETETNLMELIEKMIDKQNELEEDIQTQAKMMQKQRNEFEDQISDINDQKDEKYSAIKELIEDFAQIHLCDAAERELNNAMEKAITKGSSDVKIILGEDVVTAELTPRRINKLKDTLEKQRKKIKDRFARIDKETEELEKLEEKTVKMQNEIFRNL